MKLPQWKWKNFRTRVVAHLGVWACVATIGGFVLALRPQTMQSSRAETPPPQSRTGDVKGNGNITGNITTSGHHNSTIVNTGPGSVTVTTGAPRIAAPYDEPSEDEIKHTVLRAFVDSGAQPGTGDTVVFRNALAGVAIEIAGLEKLGCAAAAGQLGYNCRYRYRLRSRMFSTLGEDAERHADAINTFMQFLRGGSDAENVIAIRGFVKGRDGWVLVPPDPSGS
jgi:hypothetical protein